MGNRKIDVLKRYVRKLDYQIRESEKRIIGDYLMRLRNFNDTSSMVMEKSCDVLYIELQRRRNCARVKILGEHFKEAIRYFDSVNPLTGKCMVE